MIDAVGLFIPQTFNNQSEQRGLKMDYRRLRFTWLLTAISSIGKGLLHPVEFVETFELDETSIKAVCSAMSDLYKVEVPVEKAPQQLGLLLEYLLKCVESSDERHIGAKITLRFAHFYKILLGMKQ
ncbi:MAG: hypothetical protein ABH832_01820 [bacterium]